MTDPGGVSEDSGPCILPFRLFPTLSEESALSQVEPWQNLHTRVYSLHKGIRGGRRECISGFPIL
jgi:hypothetical protein